MGEIIDKVKGKIKQVAGNLSGDRKLQAEGRVDRPRARRRALSRTSSTPSRTPRRSRRTRVSTPGLRAEIHGHGTSLGVERPFTPRDVAGLRRNVALLRQRRITTRGEGRRPALARSPAGDTLIARVTGDAWNRPRGSASVSIGRPPGHELLVEEDRPCDRHRQELARTDPEVFATIAARSDGNARAWSSFRRRITRTRRSSRPSARC